MADSIRLKSFAKINWSLDVLFRREDGYHELRSIYQTISIHDQLTLSLTTGSIDVSCDDPLVPTDETNIAARAARALREATGTESGVSIEIAKRIPVGGGLGGGSSNAAVTLLGLRRLWGLADDERRILEIACSLGSDVPLFLTGGTCLGVGRGEEVYPMMETNWDDLLLVNPGFQVSTSEAYRKLSRLTRSEGARMIPFTLLAAKGISELPLSARNDLEDSVVAAHPQIGELKRALVQVGARHALMSGSGATVYGVFDNRESCEAGQSAFQARGLWCECARTINRSEYWREVFDEP